MSKKYAVIDTNVPLLNNLWYEAFKEYVVVIPITIIKEIDTKKKDMTLLGINARNMARLVEKVSRTARESEDGIARLEEGNFLPYIQTFDKVKGSVERVLDLSINDDKIIYCALEVKHDNPDSEVVLISNDCNVRSTVNHLYKEYKVDTKSYSEDEGFRAKDFYTQYKFEATDTMLSAFYSKTLKASTLGENIVANNPITLSREGKDILGRVDSRGEFVIPINKKEPYKIDGFKPLNSNQKHLVSMGLDEDIKIVSIIGRTGSGKSITSVATALHLLDTGVCSKIKLVKPYEPLGNSVGMLKGSWDEKIAPIRKTYISIFNMLGRSLDKMEDEGQVEFTTPEFERGENYFSTVLIISEAQNMNKEIKSLITRCNEGCFIFVEGDTRQVDNRFMSEDSNGLSNLINKLNGQSFFSHIYLDKSERADFLNIVDDLL